MKITVIVAAIAFFANLFASVEAEPGQPTATRVQLNVKNESPDRLLGMLEIKIIKGIRDVFKGQFHINVGVNAQKIIPLDIDFSDFLGDNCAATPNLIARFTSDADEGYQVKGDPVAYCTPITKNFNVINVSAEPPLSFYYRMSMSVLLS